MKRELVFVSRNRQLRVALSGDAQQHILAACSSVFPLETAGALFGVYAASQQSTGVLDTALIVEATIAVKRSGPYSCETDAELMERQCQERWPLTYYLGAWHTHPGASPKPSATDLTTLVERSADKKENCPQQLLVILGGLSAPLWSVHIASQGAVHELHMVDSST